jgi:hypothetical protein
MDPGRICGGRIADRIEPEPARSVAVLHGQRESGVSESNFASESRSTPRDPRESMPPRAVFPGDRRNRTAQPSEQRPSFWRRLALGRRACPAERPPADPPSTDPLRGEVASRTAPLDSQAETLNARAATLNTQAASLNTQAASETTPATQIHSPPIVPIDARTLELRVMEPMLQALVSVEAKLERSHGDLIERSDKIDQRLTHLWEIEEQLGVLGDVQESLLKVSERQRRLEAAIVGQSRVLRWLIGAVCFALTAAAFVVAALR